MVKKAKHLTFSQHNLDLLSKESYLPYCQACQDRPLEDILKLSPQGSPQETKSCTAEGPISDDCGTECVPWCHIGRMPLLLQLKRECLSWGKCNTGRCSITLLSLSLHQPSLEVRPSHELPRMLHFSHSSHGCMIYLSHPSS